MNLEKLQAMSETDFDNLLFWAFETVADDANKAHRRMAALRLGTANPSGLGPSAVLAMYRQKLEEAIAHIDQHLQG